MQMTQRVQSGRAFRPAGLSSRASRRPVLRVRAEATDAKTAGIETTATYFAPVYDIEQIKTILPHRWVSPGLAMPHSSTRHWKRMNHLNEWS